MKTKNKHDGGSFDDFLKEDGIYEEVYDAGLKKALAAEFAEALKEQNKSISGFARELKTSRSAVSRLLDENNLAISVRTITRAAAVLGKRVKLELVEA